MPSSFRLRSEMTYGLIISSRSLRDSLLLLECLSFALNKNENALGNSNLKKFWRVFPPQINCIGKNWLSYVIPNIAVTTLLYVDPSIVTYIYIYIYIYIFMIFSKKLTEFDRHQCLDPFCAIV